MSPSGQGLTVDAGKLAAGSQDVAALKARCEVIASDAVTALDAMAGSAGHAGLVSALADAAGHGARTFEQAGAAYRHVSDSLTASTVSHPVSPARQEFYVHTRCLTSVLGSCVPLGEVFD